MTCYIRSNMNYGVSTFNLDINEMEKKGQLRLCEATIHENVKINKDLETVDFSNVVVASQSVVVLNSECKNLLITRSEGLFDLREHIGAVQLFNLKMVINVTYQRGHFYNVGRLSLLHFCFKETAKLSNIYQWIELNNISTTKNTELIINRACKELLIYDCNMVINIHEVEYLEVLRIFFEFDVENRIKFTGSKRVNHINFFNICLNNSIISILEDFEEIKYVEFDNSISDAVETSINNYFCKLMAFLTSKEGF
ncbi:putative LRR containing protein, partial [Trachipleistophora hominis]